MTQGSPPRGRGGRFDRAAICASPARRAHPRAGGGADCVPHYTVSTLAGSPPRGRGRSAGCAMPRSRGGLTPARAGTATDAFRSSWSPRAGGDRLDRPVSAGLTPARAGGPWVPLMVCRRRGAHPRAGGDGQVRCRLAQQVGGLTPARAGTDWLTKAQDRAGGVRGLHPRASGADARAGAAPEGGGRRIGLTPARAGTAPPRTTSTRRPWAHPRAGGAGLVDRRPSFRYTLGLTPARAGDGHARVRWRGSPPRGRGRTITCMDGAHPRAGGDGQGRAGGGLTPARAGTAEERPRPASGLTPARAGTDRRARLGRWATGAGAHPRAGGDGRGSQDAKCSWAHPARAGTAGGGTRRGRGSPPRGRGRRR